MTQRDVEPGSEEERRDLERRADAARSRLERNIDVLERRGRRVTRTTRKVRRGVRSVLAAMVAFALLAGAFFVARDMSRARWTRRFAISKRKRRLLLPFIA